MPFSVSTSSAPPALARPIALAPTITSIPRARRRLATAFGVVLRQDAGLRLDHRDLRAHLGEGRAELQADISAADDHELLRNARQRQRLGGRDHRPAERQVRQLDRAEPVAITTISARITWRPVSVSTSTVLPSRNRHALDGLDLRPLERPATPLLRRPTMPSFQAMVWTRSISGFATMPSGFRPARCMIRSNSSAAWMRAFDGMQPH